MSNGSTHWAVRVVGAAGFDGDFKLPDFKPGALAKAMLVEIKNRESGELATFTFGGAGIGLGIGKASASPSWTDFETDRPVHIGDFQGATRVATATAGLGLNFGSTLLVFHGIGVKYDNLVEELWYGDAVDVGGSLTSPDLGTGFELSWVVGGLHMVDHDGAPAEQNYSDPDDYLGQDREKGSSTDPDDYLAQPPDERNYTGPDDYLAQPPDERNYTDPDDYLADGAVESPAPPEPDLDISQVTPDAP